MDVFEAVASRYSCRAFLPTAVPERIVRDIVKRAARAPSAGNMQPWRIYAIVGKRIEELKRLMTPRMATELPKGEGAAYTIYPEPLSEPYKARRRVTGNMRATINSSARRSLYSSRAKRRTGPRNGPTSAATCRRSACWRAATACIPARSRPESPSTAPCASSLISLPT